MTAPFTQGSLFISVIYKCRKIAEDFPTLLFLLILPLKKYGFLERLIGKYIKVLFFSFFGDIHPKEIITTGRYAESAENPLTETSIDSIIFMHRELDKILHNN